jgi:hypothetical protein
MVVGKELFAEVVLAKVKGVVERGADRICDEL